MKSVSLVVGLLTAWPLCACGAIHERAVMPHPPVCVVGGPRPVEQSMDDYGSIYTPGMEQGPAAAAPDSHLVPYSQVGPDCVAPPWWQAPESPAVAEQVRESEGTR